METNAIKAYRRESIVDSIVKAWDVPGSHPVYHEKTKSDLKRNWPTLYSAIEKLVENEHYR